MTRTLWTYLALSVSLLSAGCNAKPPTGGTGAAPPPAAVKPASLAPVSDAQAKAFAAALTLAVQSESGSEDLIDYGGMLDRASTGFGTMPKSMAKFRTGVTQGMLSSGVLPQVRDQIKQGASYTHLRTHQTTEGTRVTMRLIFGENSFLYHDFLVQDQNGRVQALDIYQSSVGEDLSETTRRLMIPLIAHENRTIVDRLSGQESLFIKHANELGKATTFRLAGEHQQALQIFNSLPIEMRNEKFIMVQQIISARGINDETAVQQVIERMRVQHPSDPATALFSIDYYYVNKDYSKSIATLQQLDQSVGGDANLWCMIAGILLETEDIPGAKAAVDKAISMEPDLLACYWNRLAIAAKEEDNATMLKTMTYIHDDLSVILDAEAIRYEPTYAKFVLSPEFKELEKLLEE